MRNYIRFKLDFCEHGNFFRKLVIKTYPITKEMIKKIKIYVIE